MTLYLQLVAVLGLFDAPSQVCSGCAVGLCIPQYEGNIAGLQEEPHIFVHPWLLFEVRGVLRLCSDAVNGGHYKEAEHHIPQREANQSHTFM